MAIIICPNCRESYSINEDIIGSTVECSTCHTEFIATVDSATQNLKATSVEKLPVNLCSGKKWILLFVVACAIIVVQFVVLMILLSQRGMVKNEREVSSTGKTIVPEVIVDQDRTTKTNSHSTSRNTQSAISLPPGAPSELLLKYVELGELPYVEVILKQNPTLDVNRPRTTGNRTALYIACEKGYLDIVKLLLKQKASAEICCEVDPSPLKAPQGYSPLTVASKNGYLDVVKVLLSSGVDIESRDAVGRTALFIAAASNKPAVVQYLCQSNAKVNIVCRKWTPLTIAAHNGNVEIIKILTVHGSNIDLEMKDTGGWVLPRTPLWHAVNQNHPAVVEALCMAGAHINIREDPKSTYRSPTPLEYAQQKVGYDEIVAILKKYGAGNKETH